MARPLLTAIQHAETARASNAVVAPGDAASDEARKISVQEAHGLLDVARDRVEQGRKRIDILARRSEWAETCVTQRPRSPTITPPER